MYHTLKKLSPIIAAVLLTACADYDIKINDNVVYTPPKLLTKMRVADSALNDCMQQTVKDNKITAIEQLINLACTNAGIKNLAGLERFYKLEVLIMNDNSITDISLLNELSALKTVALANNKITDISRLSDLSYLTKVNLAGNTKLNCETTKVLVDVVDDLSLPEHCTSQNL
jgi:Leucine-rich repeat (LRR) protein|tara:strand:- start:154 stop:669 length:516 start_codon:yes stop_codon:yes gene_type:complete